MTRSFNSHRCFHAGAFTLLEVIISTVTIAIITGAMVSTMLLAGRSVNSASGDGGVTANASDAMNQLNVDLHLATEVTERSANAITFRVPDRDGDGAPETIHYAWSGTPGDPLTRQVNGGTAVTVAANVRKFDLSYLLKTVQEEEDAAGDFGNGNGNGNGWGGSSGDDNKGGGCNGKGNGWQNRYRHGQDDDDDDHGNGNGNGNGCGNGDGHGNDDQDDDEGGDDDKGGKGNGKGKDK